MRMLCTHIHKLTHTHTHLTECERMVGNVVHQLLALCGRSKVNAPLQHAAAMAVGGHLATMLPCCLVDELQSHGHAVNCGHVSVHGRAASDICLTRAGSLAKAHMASR